MTRKDYQKFAAVLKDAAPWEWCEHYDPGYVSWRETVRKTADIFAEDNPRFNRAKFYEACGMEG